MHNFMEIYHGQEYQMHFKNLCFLLKCLLRFPKYGLINSIKCFDKSIFIITIGAAPRSMPVTDGQC